MRISFTFSPNGHAWCKVVGIHHYNNVPEHHLGPGLAVNLVHNPANPVDPNAIEVLRAADGVMIGHLRSQVAEYVQDILQLGWSVTAVFTGVGTYVSTDAMGRDFYGK